MLYDKYYEDNIVLKRDAFQNLLTNIKNYPIIDIDYISSEDKDELHDNNIWTGYTNNMPCIKITYGNPRSKKGNIIFADGIKTEIKNTEIALQNARIELNNAIYRKDKYQVAFEENKKIYTDKENQIQRIQNIWNDKIVKSREAFLRAGLSVLNFPFIPTDEQLSRYSQLIQRADLEGDQLYLNPENSDLSGYINTNILSIERIHLDYDNFTLQGYTLSDEPKTIDLDYSIFTYNESYSQEALINDLQVLRDSKVNNTYVFKENEKDSINAFINFIKAYNYISFINSFNEYGFPEEVIDDLRKKTIAQWEQLYGKNGTEKEKLKDVICYFNSGGIEIIKTKLTELYGTWNQETNINYTFKSLIESFTNNLESIVSTIQNIINNNLRKLQEKLRILYSDVNTEGSIAYYQDEIIKLENDLKRLNDDILEQAGDREIFGYKYVKLGNNIKWNDVIRYNNNNRIITYNGDIITPYNTNATLTYGNYDKVSSQQTPASEQKSGTFRIVINNEVYEVPIKGFNTQSNQDITLSTTGTIGLRSYGETWIIAKKSNDTTLTNLNLNGKVIIDGTFTPISNSMGTTENPGINLGSSTHQWNILYSRAAIIGNTGGAPSTIRPYSDAATVENAETGGTLGTKNYRWSKVYAKFIGFTDKHIEHAYITAINAHNESKQVDTTTYANSEINSVSGYFNNLYVNGNEIDPTALNDVANGGTIGQFWRGRDASIANSKPSWSNTLVGPLILSGITANLSVGGTATINGALTANSTATISGALTASSTATISGALTANSTATISGALTASSTATIEGKVTINNTTGSTDNTKPTSSTAALSCAGAGFFAKNLTANKIFNAVFNDYAEYRTTINLEPGRVVIDNDDGSLSCSSQRLQPGAQIISDTFGHSMGYTNECQTPLAVAGRVLVYTYQDRNNYHAGMAVCSAPNGTVDIMTREEIKEYPDCIIGIVSEIPQYETWGTDQIKINNRIWIKIK